MANRTSASGTIDATGAGDAIFADRFSLSLGGTWTGTVKLQMFDVGGSEWVDVPNASWTAITDAPKACENKGRREVRLHFTRSTGSLAYTLVGGD